ncbi:amino acid permease [Cytophaga aurantiaca]|uniref:amino acid permease n=1 Tax=Cytophaga aurantiaca TaxID=29530 RepID=UPI0003766348|nr:amino acid permease [Cytophaga aurantiaca]
MPSPLFKTKSIASILKEENGELKKSLGATSLILLGIGAIIGAGIFSLTGIAAAENAGPAVTISFMIAGLGCAFAGLCYAEFASMLPIAGSAYTYSYATLGEFIAWIIGWDLILEYAVGAATVAISWSRYLSKLLEKLGVENIPYQWMMSPFETIKINGAEVHGIVNIPAIFITCLMSLVLIRGMSGSAKLNSVIVALKITVVIAFIVLGWSYMDPANHADYIPANTGAFEHFGWTGVMTGAAVVFFSFIGFDAVSTAAQEAKNPQRDMPIGILGSLIICTILYVLFSYVMTGLENYQLFKGEAAPVALAIAATPYAFFQELIIIAILAGYTSVIMVLLMGQSRVFFSMSKDGLVPAIFSEVHPKYQTPWKSNILFAVLVSLFAGLVPVSVVGEMTSIGTLFAFVLVCVGVLVLRKKQPDAPRAFRTPWVPFVPIMGIIICFYLMYALPFDTWVRLIVWMAIGIAIYFLYSRHHSKINKEQQL